MSTGILSFGAYIPRLRLQRGAAVAANSWFNAGMKSQAKGERAMANWDEDSVTMAVEAARDCLAGLPRELAAVHLASTTLPFDDRSNSGIVAAALNLPSVVSTLDLAGSLRAGTSGLIAALRGAGASGPVLLAAADHRQARMASSQELAYGDGAAALLVGEGNVIARVIATHSEAIDFVDHFRGRGAEYDYAWEERWVREEGYLKIVPAAIARGLERAGVAAASVAHFCLPSTLSKMSQAVARKVGIPEEAVRDNLAAVCGDTGTAHPLVMLVHALQCAKPGERIVVAQFAQGCDVLVLEATSALASHPARSGVVGSLARRRPETNYAKLGAFADQVPLERGMRAEIDRGAAFTSLYRNRKFLLGLIGGRCTKCGTLQLPKTNVCVRPECNAVKTQVDHAFADLPAEVFSFTADVLTYSPDPPAVYGMVKFAAGGRIFIDFADADPEKLAVGMPMRMVFRIKDVDPQRGFTKYFWKATPVAAT